MAYSRGKNDKLTKYSTKYYAWKLTCTYSWILPVILERWLLLITTKAQVLYSLDVVFQSFLTMFFFVKRLTCSRVLSSHWRHWRARVAHWVARALPPTSVAWVRILAPTPYVGWVLLLVLSLAPRGSSPCTQVPLSLKTNTSEVQFDLRSLGHLSPSS